MKFQEFLFIYLRARDTYSGLGLFNLPLLMQILTGGTVTLIFYIANVQYTLRGANFKNEKYTTLACRTYLPTL